MNPIIKELTDCQLIEGRDHFKVGDGVRVHVKVREGDKERVQIFAGIVLCRKGRGISETFTVRKISFGEGVERIFPVHSRNLVKIEVERESVPMRAKLYYLRGRIGKNAVKVKENREFRKNNTTA
ncbi:MAG: 50S ribosomal protein L19 [Puniceicoccales bacterium]|jgi:large subunit ribosomal protein L19|nr:50S ribosomal protein L19 [Puniceicoccales bacterium]